MSAVLRYGFAIGPTGNWDPIKITTGTIDQVYLNQVYDRLVYQDAHDKIQPLLATSWSANADDTSTTFKLRKGVVFSDGSPFNASVAKANLDRAMGPQSYVSKYFAAIRSVQVVNPLTLTITTKEPDAALPYLLASPYADMAGMAAIEDPAKMPIGTGPFTLQSYNSTQAVFVRNQSHFFDGFTYPARKEIITVPDGLQMLNAVKTGELDVGVMTGSALPALYATGQQSGFQEAIQPGANWYVLYLNGKDAPFDNPAVRKAVALGLNSSALARAIAYTPEFCTPTQNIFPPGMAGYVPSLETAPQYDQAQAIAELKKDGAYGASISMVRSSFQSITSASEAVEAELVAIGFKVSVTTVEPGEALAAYKSGKYTASVYTRPALIGDPSAILPFYTAPTMPVAPDPALTNMVGAADVAPQGPARDTALTAVSRYLAANPVNITLCRFNSEYYASDKVGGLNELPEGGIGDFGDTRSLTILK